MMLRLVAIEEGRHLDGQAHQRRHQAPQTKRLLSIEKDGDLQPYGLAQRCCHRSMATKRPGSQMRNGVSLVSKYSEWVYHL